jgi:hypothetical protein
MSKVQSHGEDYEVTTMQERVVVEMAVSWVEMGGDSNIFWRVITGCGPGPRGDTAPYPSRGFYP